jgi:hypothetical protein
MFAVPLSRVVTVGLGQRVLFRILEQHPPNPTLLQNVELGSMCLKNTLLTAHLRPIAVENGKQD